MNKTGATNVMEAINLETGEYSASQKINIGTDKVDLKSLISRDDKFGEYAWSVISKIIKYSSSLVPGITKEFNDIDEAMRLGFNWAKGPFEMLEEIGVENFFSKIDEFKGNEFLEKLSKISRFIFLPLANFLYTFEINLLADEHASWLPLNSIIFPLYEICIPKLFSILVKFSSC